MKPAARYSILAVFLTCAAFGAAQGYLAGKRPVRSGSLTLPTLSAPVNVRYDELGVPHIQAGNEADLYRALGYVHAQDRLFQMEMVRRLARGQLAEVFGPKLVETDRLFRVLRLGQWAETQATQLDPQRPATQALLAYLDGVNAYQNSRPAPLEFDLLGIPKRPFTVADTLATSAYLAFSFAAAFKTEPVLSYIRDELGPRYLRTFDLAWHPQGVLGPEADRPPVPMQGKRKPSFPALARSSAEAAPATTPWRELARLAQLADDAGAQVGVGAFAGSNAWAVAGTRSAGGKALLAGDPHIAFATPAVWYEAHLQAPGFELYGHHAALVPVALLGLNRDFAWSLTMFQNDDVDFVRETLNPKNPAQAWAGTPARGRWVDILSREEQIVVKGAAPVTLTLRDGPHGPIINDALPTLAREQQPIALWWTLYQSPPRLLDAMYALGRADTLAKARAAVQQIDAPGLNVVWANAAGDIAWWAAARLPKRPAGVNPALILDAAKGEADKPGWLPFSANPQEENPARGYVVSANHQPAGSTPIPGYYNLHDRARRLDNQLARPDVRWDVATTQALQTDVTTGYGPRLVARMAPLLRPQLTAAEAPELLDLLQTWDGRHGLDDIAPTLFNQWLYEFARAAMSDEMGSPEMFDALLRVRALDRALPRLLADADSPWWDVRGTAPSETREQILLSAWRATLAHLRTLLGEDSSTWFWHRAHFVNHGHPLGQKKPLDRLFDVGPLPAPGGHETPNNYDRAIGPLPITVVYGPSTRRVVDFGTPGQSLGINPVGQSGVPGDRHYADQAQRHVRGEYRPQHLNEDEVLAHTVGLLRLLPTKNN